MWSNPAANDPPLAYMLAVMSAPTADPSRRDRMAQAAAPFCHPRVSDHRIGSKEAEEMAAQHLPDGEWAQLIK